MAVVPSVAAATALANWTGQTAATLLWVLRLYENDVVPTGVTTAADLTEVSGGGYAPVVLQPADWTFTPGAPSVALQPQKLFGFTGGTGGWGTVYGYYIVDGAGEIVLAQRLASPPFYPAAGDIIKVTPRLSLGSLAGD
jgi:hypothetical protein